MQAPDRDLWRRLEAFDLDDPSASLTFTRRLARENDWDVAFASRVVDEYKRFVFLAMAAGHEVTPSDEVDQAWHLHLTYTRSYWHELCGEVLGRPLHHGPTKGGSKEGQRFEEQYDATLTSYRKLFGEDPPADIWPPSATRFGEAAGFVRVNRQRVWLVPKPSSLFGNRRNARIVLLLAVPFGVGFGPVANADPLEGLMAAFVLVFVVIAVISMVASLARLAKPNKRRRRDHFDSGSGCSTYFPVCGGSGSNETSGDNGVSGCASSGCSSSGCGGGGCGGD